MLAWAPRFGGDAHVGRTETSVMLAPAPDRVRLDAARAGNTAPIRPLLPQLQEQGLLGITANGVLGDPTGANAEEGERLLQQAVAELAGLAAGHAACSEGPGEGRML